MDILEEILVSAASKVKSREESRPMPLFPIPKHCVRSKGLFLIEIINLWSN